MADYTQYYNLIKPGENEFYDIAQFNRNAELIDEALHELETGKEELGTPSSISGTSILPANGWTLNGNGFYVQQVAVAALKAGDDVDMSYVPDLMSPAATKIIKKAWNLIAGADVYDGAVSLYSSSPVTADIPFAWRVVR